ncbi:hypothetical protein MCUN1_002522 [Malassezia cuniculi]|uniref:BZIP domain-containing protein n=1 Tax=Malassezia cuniculi TaxID=948313 RepID=A0AAF0ES19_9BASI|nr:hypothetical protein MCUN1_002522 [Malassezia cuniculi]
MGDVIDPSMLSSSVGSVDKPVGQPMDLSDKSEEAKRARLLARQARNRQSAQYSREKKKLYVVNLEQQVKQLQQDKLIATAREVEAVRKRQELEVKVNELSAQKVESEPWCGGATDTAANGSSLDAPWSGDVSDASEPSVLLEEFAGTTGSAGIPWGEARSWTSALPPRDPTETELSTAPDSDMSLLLAAFEPRDDSEPQYDYYDFDLLDPRACGQTPVLLHAVEQPAAGAGLVHAA